MSRLKSKLVKKIVTIATVAVAACSDGSTPVAPTLDDAPRMSATAPGRYIAAQRAVARVAEESATAVIGASGGSIAVSGVTFTVPAGALTQPVQIKMTVPAGKYFEVHFEPHGLEFRKPTSVSMKLDGVDVSNFQLIYFNSMSQSGVVEGLEAIDLKVSDDSATGTVTHFSGYIIAEA